MHIYRTIKNRHTWLEDTDGLAITFSKLKFFLKELGEIVTDPTACTKKNDADL